MPLFRHFALSRYLSIARLRLEGGQDPFWPRLRDRWKEADTGFRNLEHWLGERAYRSTRRTFASIDLRTDLPASDGGSVVIRGWILDLREPICAVSLPGPLEGFHFVRYGDARPDVSAAFPGERNAPKSGFLAMLPASALDSQTGLKLRYTVRSGVSVDLSLPVPAPRYAVCNAGGRDPSISYRTSPPSALLISSDPGPLNSSLTDEVYSALCEEGHTVEVAALAGAVIRNGPAIIVENATGLAAPIGFYRPSLRIVAITGAPDRPIFEQVVPTAIARAPRPKIVWLGHSPAPALDWPGDLAPYTPLSSFEGVATEVRPALRGDYAMTAWPIDSMGGTR